MAEFICPKCENIKKGHNVSIKIIDGEARHDIKCDECGSHMNNNQPKTGVPSFRSDRWGGVI